MLALFLLPVLVASTGATATASAIDAVTNTSTAAVITTTTLLVNHSTAMTTNSSISPQADRTTPTTAIPTISDATTSHPVVVDTCPITKMKMVECMKFNPLCCPKIGHLDPLWAPFVITVLIVLAVVLAVTGVIGGVVVFSRKKKKLDEKDMHKNRAQFGFGDSLLDFDHSGSPLADRMRTQMEGTAKNDHTMGI